MIKSEAIRKGMVNNKKSGLLGECELGSTDWACEIMAGRGWVWSRVLRFQLVEQERLMRISDNCIILDETATDAGVALFFHGLTSSMV